jgi:predicted dehydrogenase
MAETIRWGILATGGIAATFTEDLLTLPDAEIVAVGSRTAGKADKFADRFGIRNRHGSWRALAEDPEVDIVYVATTHNAHYDAAAMCLDAGKAVLCEKPFTLNRVQARQLMAKAKERNAFLMEAMWMRCNPAFLKMLEVIRDGAIGEVQAVHADFHLAGSFAPDHRLRDPQLGGGALLDLGVYPVTFAHAILGVPTTVKAWANLTPEGADANTGMIFGYEGGPLAALTCGLCADSPVTAVVSGTLGRIELGPTFYRPAGFQLHRTGQAPERVAVPYSGNGMNHEAVEAMRCLRMGAIESPLVSWRDTLDVMTLLDGVREQIGVRYPGEAVEE